MVAGINTVGSMGYVNPCDDYFGLYSNSGLNTGMTTGMTTGTTYPSIMNPGMYSIPQNLWNDPIGQMQYQYDMNNQYQGFNIRANAQQISLTDQCTALATVISEGQEDEILNEFNELVSTLKSQPQYQQLSEQELKSYAKLIFQNITGISLTQAVEKNCTGSFGTGLKNVLNPFGDDSVSKEDLLAEINGTKKKKGADAAKVTGSVVGVAGAAAAGAGIGTLICPGVGTVIGAVAGGAIGLLKSLF